MEYQPPINGDTGDDNRSFVNGNALLGVEGSIPSAESIEHTQREIIAAIEAAGLVPDEGDLMQLAQAIAASAGGSSGNVGDFFWHVGTTAPDDSIVPNGATGLSRAAFPEFYAHLDSAGLIVDEATKDDWEFGDGDGVTTFSLGDWRAEFIRALDGGRGVDVGRVLASYQADEFKSHTHTIKGNGGSSGGSYLSVDTYNGTVSGMINNAGGIETRPRNIALLPCIRYA